MILRRIRLFSANKIKSSESLSKQPTQLIIAANNCHKNVDKEFVLPPPKSLQVIQMFIKNSFGLIN